MDKDQVQYIIDECMLPDSCDNSSLKETHISWLILSDNYVFKIKKPVKFSFLDYSSLEKREFFCKEELRLNRRMEPDMYLGVLPVNKNMGIEEKGFEGKVVDYAVKMQRLDEDYEMARLLRLDKVTGEQIDKLARKLARFHQKVQVVKNAFNTFDFQEKFADILSQEETIVERYGDDLTQKVKECDQLSFDYLNSIRSYSNERVISGFRRDCHGDLNVENIFLYDEPIIFDCIDFNSDYRHIDILNDIAFLCVDLDFYGKEDLSYLLYKSYLDYYGIKENADSRNLFDYYKSYRANVRAKIILIKLEKDHDADHVDQDKARKYLDLMIEYMNRINH